MPGPLLLLQNVDFFLVRPSVCRFASLFVLNVAILKFLQRCLLTDTLVFCNFLSCILPLYIFLLICKLFVKFYYCLFDFKPNWQFSHIYTILLQNSPLDICIDFVKIFFYIFCIFNLILLCLFVLLQYYYFICLYCNKYYWIF